MHIAKSVFDKLLRKTERIYPRNKINMIEVACTQNPKDFCLEWLKSLGPHKTSEIPMKVELAGVCINDNNGVLDIWKCDFEKLHNTQNVNNSDVFYNEIHEIVQITETEMSDERYDENEDINGFISLYSTCY